MISTHKLLFCLGIVFLLEASAPVSAAVFTSDAATGRTITDANDATATLIMRPKKKVKKAKKKGRKKGCEAYNS